MFGFPSGGGGTPFEGFPVTQDEFVITAATPASTDGHVMLALRLDIPIAVRILSTANADGDPQFLQSTGGKLFIQPRYLFGNSAFQLTNQVIAAQPTLRIEPQGVNSANQPIGRLVYNGAGAGNKRYQNANGDIFIVWDIGAAAANCPAVQWNAGEGSMTNRQSDADMHVYDVRGNNALPIPSNAGVGLEDLYVDTATTTDTERIVQGSGSNITFTPFNPNTNETNPEEQFWLKVFHNNNGALPAWERLEHNAGGGQVPFPIPVAIFSSDLSTGEKKLLGYIVVRPNVNAAADGDELRDDGSGWIADLADDSSIALDPTFAPNSLTIGA